MSSCWIVWGTGFGGFVSSGDELMATAALEDLGRFGRTSRAHMPVWAPPSHVPSVTGSLRGKRGQHFTVSRLASCPESFLRTACIISCTGDRCLNSHCTCRARRC